MKNKSVFNPNFRLIGALDSARTAHLSGSSIEKDNWWLPHDKRTWTEHTASAEGMLLKQILWGDIIALPRNQYLDSFPWFNLAEYLIQLKIPTFTISIYDQDLNTELTPVSFVKDISHTFLNPRFALSAWPGLAMPERDRIGQNIIRNMGFHDMFDQVKLDSAFIDIFQCQQEVLEKLYLYLKNNPRTISRATGTKVSLWQRLWKDIRNAGFIEDLIANHGDDFAKEYKNRFIELRKKAISLYKDHSSSDKLSRADKWLSIRTNLYEEIYDCDQEMRDFVRQHIDFRYCEGLSLSTTGQGRYGYLDRSDTRLYHEIRDHLTDSLDKQNDTPGLLEDTDVLLLNTEKRERSFLSGVVETLNDTEIQHQIELIRLKRQYGFASPEIRQKEELDHITFMAEKIPELVVEKSDKTNVVRFSYRTSTSLLVVILGMLFFPDSLVEVGFAKVLYDLFKDKTGDRLNKLLEDKGEKILIDTLFRGEKRVLSGKVRDWLAKPNHSVSQG